jgi:hypothetical protein
MQTVCRSRMPGLVVYRLCRRVRDGLRRWLEMQEEIA